MLVQTLSTNAVRVRKTNATDNGFPSRIPRATMPYGRGTSAAQATASAVYGLANGGTAQNSLHIKPFGAGADNTTFSLRVIGWTLINEQGLPDEGIEVWDPTVLVELACTLSAVPIGLSGRIVTNTDLFADTMTVTYGNANVTVAVTSPANDIAAHAVVDLEGAQMVEVTFTTGASATSCNAIIRLL